MSTAAIKKKTRQNPVFTPGQELGNAITHGIGAALSVVALVILVLSAATRGDAWFIVSYAVFGTSMVALYLSSSIFHALKKPNLKRLFEKFDHAAIFVLIAGSYTAFALTILRDRAGWWLFGAAWAIAIAGIVMEILFLNRWPYMSLALYLAMGWMIVLVWGPFTASAPSTTVWFMLAGGLSYTAGTLFYALGRRWGWFHIGWHLFVIGGTACHFLSALAALPS